MCTSTQEVFGAGLIRGPVLNTACLSEISRYSGVGAICDLVGKLHCRPLQKVAPTHVLESQRISDIHEEGGLSGGGGGCTGSRVGKLISSG